MNTPAFYLDQSAKILWMMPGFLRNDDVFNNTSLGVAERVGMKALHIPLWRDMTRIALVACPRKYLRSVADRAPGFYKQFSDWWRHQETEKPEPFTSQLQTGHRMIEADVIVDIGGDYEEAIEAICSRWNVPYFREYFPFVTPGTKPLTDSEFGLIIDAAEFTSIYREDVEFVAEMDGLPFIAP